MKKPVFTGLSHVCIFVDDVMEAFQYYERILGAVPNQHIPHWKNKGFFQAGGFYRRSRRRGGFYWLYGCAGNKVHY